MLNWQTVAVVMILLAGALVNSGLIVFARRRRTFPGAEWFVLLCGSAALWLVTYALELSSPGLAVKMVWAGFEYIGIVLVPVAWFLFASAFTGSDGYLTPRRQRLLFVLPALTMLMVITNPLHRLHWADFQLGLEGPLRTFQVLAYGPWWWLHFAYSYGMLLAGTLILLRSARRSAHIFQGQFLLLLAASVLPWLGNVSFLTGLEPVPQLDLSPLFFTLSALFLWMGIRRLRFFDLAPLSKPPVIVNLDGAALVLDRQERLLEFNPLAAAWFGLQPERTLGLPIAQAWREWQQLDPALARSPEVSQTIALTVGTARRYYALNITPLWDAHQRLTGRLLRLQDVTSDQLAEEAMALAQVKTEFLAKVSHELRTPLTSILGVTEMLDYGVYGPLTLEQHQALILILESTRHMNRLVDDLLEQARLTRGDFSLNMEDVRLRHLLDRLHEHLVPQARKKGLNFFVGIHPAMPACIRSDSARLYQILFNLAENALKFTSAGQVEVWVWQQDGQAVFEVRDTGIGIPADMQDAIYDAFKQIAPPPGQPERGFGLGLAIVKQLTVLMAGKIELDSRVGVGSTFKVYLPLGAQGEQLYG